VKERLLIIVKYNCMRWICASVLYQNVVAKFSKEFFTKEIVACVSSKE